MLLPSLDPIFLVHLTAVPNPGKQGLRYIYDCSMPVGKGVRLDKTCVTHTGCAISAWALKCFLVCLSGRSRMVPQLREANSTREI